MAKLEQIVQFLDALFQPQEFPDYPHALNGLQVQGPTEVERVAVAVDASEITIRDAREGGAQLLLVHHGLFWGGLGPLTGPRFRKVSALLSGGVALYSMHLPLDAHPEHGNCALLARALGLTPVEGFAPYQGAAIGWWARTDVAREDLVERLAGAVGGPARVIPGGPETVRRVGVVTGGGAGSLAGAAAQGLDSLVTGEAPHHAFHEAMELGVNLFLGGHYATETFGVRSVAELLEREFGLGWDFIDCPTGL